jgi:SAM-dependent MidA family methyltransferase
MWLRPHLEAAGGLLRFDRFMELALYDPQDGYYGSQIASVGPRGDFSTSATLSSLLARGIANWLRPSRPAHVIEIGAGTGQLAIAVLRHLGAFGLGRRLGLPVRRGTRLTYHIVERSPALESIQRRLLRRAARWHRTVEDALAAANGRASLFSNELVDAFPPRVFRRDNDWSELFLALRNGALGEVWQPADSQPSSTAFDHPWPVGQRLEVHQSYRDWLASWQPHWTAGELLTIDYGGSPSEIYHRRPAGSLRAYYRHQRQNGPQLYELAGRKDLTADVNFDDLEAWGRELGLETISRTDQRDWLATFSDQPNAADHFLTDPHGAGSAFKVLVQRRPT